MRKIPFIHRDVEAASVFSALVRKFITFAGVGVIGTAGHYLTLIVLVSVAGQGVLLSTSCGFLVGALINYLLNYRFTFNSNKPHREAATKFLAVASIGFLVNGACMQLLVENLEWHYLLSQVLVTGIVLLWTFTGNLLWTFREKSDER